MIRLLRAFIHLSSKIYKVYTMAHPVMRLQYTYSILAALTLLAYIYDIFVTKNHYFWAVDRDIHLNAGVLIQHTNIPIYI